MRACLITALLLACPCHARGADDDRVRAGAIFREANALFAAKDYAGALEKYRAARAIFASPRIELNIGWALDKLNRPTGAAVHFERFLTNVAAKDPPAIVASAKKRLGEIRATLGRLLVGVRRPGADIEVDGKSYGHTPRRESIYMTPGTYVVRLSKPGHQEWKGPVTFVAGQVHKVIVILRELSAEPAGTTPSPPVKERAPSKPAAAPLAKPVPTAPPSQGARRAKTIWGYTLLGTGAAAAIAAAVMYGIGVDQGSSAHDAYRASKDVAAIDEHRMSIDAARTKLVVGHVLSGAAAGLVGAAVVLLVTRPAGDERATASVGVAPLAGGMSVSLRGAF